MKKVLHKIYQVWFYSEITITYVMLYMECGFICLILQFVSTKNNKNVIISVFDNKNQGFKFETQ